MFKSNTLKYTTQGAHLYHWQPHYANAPVLFCSEKVVFQKDKAIRGGVPICWPWFGPKDGLPQHGFARTMEWLLVENNFENQINRIQFTMHSDESTKLFFPFDFKITFDIIENENNLLLSLTTVNLDQRPFPITAALHSYFHVDDISNIEIIGLGDSSFIDKLDNQKIKRQPDAVLEINEEIDRIYLSSNTTKIIDHYLKRTITIDHNASSIVVWNPWAEKCQSISDLSAEEYKKFICIESAIAPKEKILLPNETNILEQNITIDVM